KQGFDTFVGYLDQHHAHNYYPTFLIKNGERFSLPNVVPGEGDFGQGVATEKRQYSHDVIMEAAMKWLDDNHDQRFFLYLPITLPHANNEAKQEGMEIPSYGSYANKDWPEPQKGTAAMISRIDTDMGQLFKKLKEYGIDEDTIVFFTSDNGPHREGGNNPDFFDSNGPLRGIKRDLYEGGIRVPMIVRWPGKTNPGTRSAHIGYHGDLLATSAELAGVEPPAGLDSVSFVPAILGNANDQKEHEFLYWEFYERAFKQGVRAGDWKYVKVNDKEELYNLADDLAEENDLAKKHPDQLARLRTMAEQAHVPSPRWDKELKPRKKN
ncbi:MAG: sulfatase-like hydrolase/transferase, partial [Planctomycetaceae bacterium]|nr:sulfatase-like hydrolase/transferase [Planctomycetaceae bacterium]